MRGRVEDGGSLRWKATSKDLWSVHADSTEARILKKEAEPSILARNKEN
jgi:hypothetical protein